MIRQKKGDLAIRTRVLRVFGQGGRVNVSALWANCQPLDARVNAEGTRGGVKRDEGRRDTRIQKRKETGEKGK
jgi:hypothetical protein